MGSSGSGGFDSSFVVACFERAKPAAELQLYTCVPHVKNGRFTQSEEQWAEQAATYFRSSMIKVRVSSDDLPREFPSLVRLQEEPFSSPVVFAQLQLFRAAQDNDVGMMLSGQGGDTLFASSTDQLLMAVLAHLRRGRWGSAAAALLKAGAQLPQGSFIQVSRAAVRAALPRGLLASSRRFRHLSHPDWLRGNWFELDSTVAVPDRGLPMLRFEHRNSVACSIVNRMPLLTVEVQDFVWSLPPEYLVTANQPIKSIESAAMRGMVPDAIVDRRQRCGFPVLLSLNRGSIPSWEGLEQPTAAFLGASGSNQAAMPPARRRTSTSRNHFEIWFHLAMVRATKPFLLSPDIAYTCGGYASIPSCAHEKRHDREHREHHVVSASDTGSRVARYSLIERPRSQSTNPNSATSMKPRAMHPISSLDERVGGTARRKTIHRAAPIVTASMNGISISSDTLAPRRGTTNSVPVVPSTKPAPDTSEK